MSDELAFDCGLQGLVEREHRGGHLPDRRKRQVLAPKLARDKLYSYVPLTRFRSERVAHLAKDERRKAQVRPGHVGEEVGRRLQKAGKADHRPAAREADGLGLQPAQPREACFREPCGRDCREPERACYRHPQEAAAQERRDCFSEVNPASSQFISPELCRDRNGFPLVVDFEHHALIVHERIDQPVAAAAVDGDRLAVRHRDLAHQRLAGELLGEQDDLVTDKGREIEPLDFHRPRGFARQLRFTHYSSPF